MKRSVAYRSAVIALVATASLPFCLGAVAQSVPQTGVHTQTGIQTTPAPVGTEAQTSTPLKPGDRLQLTVVGFPELSGEQLVSADGSIQVPMAGLIYVGGLTPPEAVTQLTESLRPYVRHPQVGISLLTLSPLRVSITGEVLRPGPRSMTPTQATADASTVSDTNRPVTLSDALTLAGGITPNADVQNIIIRRLVPGTPIAGAQPERTEIKVDLWQAVQTGDLAADPRLHDGDEIIIPTVQAGAVDQRDLLASTIAPTRILIQVAGEVQNPGQIEIDPRAGVSEAVAAAGGPTPDADRNSIELLRMADGRLERQTYDFGEASSPLQDGDVIVVSKSDSSNVLDFLGRIVPLFYLF